jgi:hypothetical protein
MSILDRPASMYKINGTQRELSGTTTYDAIKDRYDREYLSKLVAAAKAIRQAESERKDENTKEDKA